MNQKFYEKDWFLWVSLIFFAPVGIFLLWKNKKFNKNVTIALTAIFSIWFIIALSHGGKNESPQETTTANKQIESPTKTDEVKKDTQTKSNKPSNDELLKNISVSFDYQDVIDGKKKVVMTVTNNTDYVFDGTVMATFQDDTGSVAGTDGLMEKKIANNSETTVILWGKEKATSADYKVNGSFSEPKQDAQTKNDYELVSTLKGQDYNSFYVVVQKIDKDSLVNIVKEFRSKYTKDTLASGFQIGFFLPDNKSDATNQDFSTTKAMYHENYNNGLSELYLQDTDEKIEVK